MWWTTILLVILLPACSPDVQSYAAKHTTVAERSFAERFLRLSADGKIDSVMPMLSTELRTDSTRRVAERIGALLATVKLDSLHFMGVNIFENPGAKLREVNLSYEGPTADHHWALANVATRYSPAGTAVFGFSAYPLSQPLELTNAFRLKHQSAVHFIWLALALIMPVITIATAGWMVRSRMPRRWLWAIVSLVATPATGLNWTTGQLTHQVTFFLLFGGAAMRGSAGLPWILSVGVPTGAIVAYFRLRAWRRTTVARTSVPTVAA
jgi:hypothetical protein